jgi:hypothetical protein
MRTFRRDESRAAATRLAALTTMALAASLVAVAPPASGATVTASLVQTIDLSSFGRPSSDPAGVIYLPSSDRLLVADSEIDELPTLFQGSNLFELTRTGSSTGYGSTTAYSNEPTGIAWDQASGTMYVTDDDTLEVYVVSAGGDGTPGTGDDSVVRSFGVSAAGFTDPQGVAYKASSGEMFIVDGAGNKVFRVTGGANGVIDGQGDDVSSFPVPGSGRPQGIVYDQARNTLVVCDHQSKHLYELETDGTLLSTIGVGAANLNGGCDVAVAPSSTTPGKSSFWVTTRGAEGSPGVQNDGRLFELMADLPARPGQATGTPAVTITSPALSPASYVSGSEVEFRATAYDRTGADLTGAIRWSSSVEGPLGTGGTIRARLTGQGLRIITAAVTDSGGEIASATVTVDVWHGDPRPDLLRQSGYWLVASDGGIFNFGDAGFLGSAGAVKLSQPIVSMARTPSGAGYWLLAADGGIFAFGDAAFHGSTGDLELAKPIIGMASTPTGKGYWLVASDGGMFAFGDAAFLGSTGNLKLARPIVGMASTPTGKGYWLVASDGGIFAFGDAAFHGSTGDLTLAKSIVGMTATATGSGYWMVASDGGIFAFGDARFHGSTGDLKLAKPIVGMASTPTGKGYRLVASDGGMFAFGDATFLGSTGNLTLAKPIVGMATR